MEGALIEIVEQVHLDSILVRNMDKLAKSIRFMDDVTGQAVGGTSIITPIVAFVKRHVERIAEEVRFEMSLEHQLTK